MVDESSLLVAAGSSLQVLLWGSPRVSCLVSSRASATNCVAELLLIPMLLFVVKPSVRIPGADASAAVLGFMVSSIF